MPPPLCAVCGTQRAIYICQNCGRATCANCIDARSLNCYDCATTRPVEGEYSQPIHFSLASLLLMIAFAAIFVGMLLVALGSVGNLGSTSGGAVILIGPIPIILGIGPYSIPLIALSVGLTIVALVFFLLLRRRVP
jgi:uncharacterized membrane protein